MGAWATDFAPVDGGTATATPTAYRPIVHVFTRLGSQRFPEAARKPPVMTCRGRVCVVACVSLRGPPRPLDARGVGGLPPLIRRMQLCFRRSWSTLYDPCSEVGDIELPSSSLLLFPSLSLFPSPSPSLSRPLFLSPPHHHRTLHLCFCSYLCLTYAFGPIYPFASALPISVHSPNTVSSLSAFSLLFALLRSYSPVPFLPHHMSLRPAQPADRAAPRARRVLGFSLPPPPPPFPRPLYCSFHAPRS